VLNNNLQFNKNLFIPRVFEDVALPFNLCPFCRSDIYVTGNNAKSDSCLNTNKEYFLLLAKFEVNLNQPV
jgi:hypothetical protein